MPVRLAMNALIGLKGHPVHRAIPVVMCGQHSQRDVVAALKAGAPDYVAKPFGTERGLRCSLH